MANIATAFVTLRPDMRGFNSEVSRGISQAQSAARSGAKGLAGSFVNDFGGAVNRGIGTALKRGLQATLAGVGVTAGKALWGGMQRVLDTEDARKMFGQLGLGIDEVDGLLAQLDETFRQGSFAYPDVYDVSAQLMSSGTAMEDLNDRTLVAGNMAAFAGAELDHVGEILAIVTANGKLSGDELRRLGQMGIPVGSMLAESLGVSNEELRDMVSNGEISADMFFELMGDVEQLDGAMNSMADTTRGAFKNFLSGLNVIGEAVLAPWFGENGDMVQFFKAINERLFANVDTFERWGQSFYDSMQRAFETVGNFIDGLRSTDAPIQTMSEALARSGDSAYNFGTMVREAFDQVAGAVQVATDWIAEHREEIIRIAQAVVPAVAAVTGLAAGLSALATVFGIIKAATPIGMIMALASGLVYAYQNSETFRNVVNNAFQAVSDVVTRVVGYFQGLVERWSEGTGGMGRATERLRDQVGPIWENIRGIVVGVVDIIVAVAGNVMERIREFWERSGDRIMAFVSRTWDNVVRIIEGATRVIRGIIDIFAGVLTGDWSRAWGGLQNVVSGTWNIINGLVRQAIEALRLIIGLQLDRIRQNWSQRWQAFREVVSRAWEAIQRVVRDRLTALRDFIVRSGQTIRERWSTFWTAVREIASRIWDAIRTLVRNRFEAIRDFIQRASQTIRERWNTFWTAVRTIATTLWNAIRDLVRNRIEAVRDIVHRVSTTIRERWNAFWTAARDIASRLWDAIRDRIRERIERARDIIHNVSTTIRERWSDFWTRVRDTTQRIMDTIRDRISEWGRRVQSIFTNIRNAISRVWNGIKSAVAGPINWVIDKINDLIGKINTVLTRFKIPKIPTLGRISTSGMGSNQVADPNRAPQSPALSRNLGGFVPGQGPDRDSVLAHLTPGEFVFSRKAVANLGKTEVEQFHQLARQGRVARDDPGWLEFEPPPGMVLGAEHNVGYSSRGFGGVRPHVARSGHFINRRFGPFAGGIGGVGRRPGPSDHPRGLALDFMTMRNVSQGNRVVGHLLKNAAHHLVKYIIWRQAINTGSGWRRMANRGSPTANHMDHPHVSYLAGGSGRGFSDSGGGAMGIVIEWAFEQIRKLIDPVLNSISSYMSDKGVIGEMLSGGAKWLFEQVIGGVKGEEQDESFRHGGRVPGEGPRRATVHGGEFVLSKEMLQALNRGGLVGYQSGGTVQRVAQFRSDIGLPRDRASDLIWLRRIQQGLATLADAFDRIRIKAETLVARQQSYNVPALREITQGPALAGNARLHAEAVERLRQAYEDQTAAMEANARAMQRVVLQGNIRSAQTAKERAEARLALALFDQEARLARQRLRIEQLIAREEARQIRLANRDQFYFERLHAEQQIALMNIRLKQLKTFSDEWMQLRREIDQMRESLRQTHIQGVGVISGAISALRGRNAAIEALDAARDNLQELLQQRRSGPTAQQLLEILNAEDQLFQAQVAFSGRAALEAERRQIQAQQSIKQAQNTLKELRQAADYHAQAAFDLEPHFKRIQEQVAQLTKRAQEEFSRSGTISINTQMALDAARAQEAAIREAIEQNKEAASSTEEMRLAEIDLEMARYDAADAARDASRVGQRAALELQIATEGLNEAKDWSAQLDREITEARKALTDAQMSAIAAEQQLREAGWAMMEVGQESIKMFEDLARAVGLSRSEIRGLTDEYKQVTDIGRATEVPLPRIPSSVPSSSDLGHTPLPLPSHLRGAKLVRSSHDGRLYLILSNGRWYEASGPGQRQGVEAIWGKPGVTNRSRENITRNYLAGRVVDIFPNGTLRPYYHMGGVVPGMSEVTANVLGGERILSRAHNNELMKTVRYIALQVRGADDPALARRMERVLRPQSRSTEDRMLERLEEVVGELKGAREDQRRNGNGGQINIDSLVLEIQGQFQFANAMERRRAAEQIRDMLVKLERERV